MRLDLFCRQLVLLQSCLIEMEETREKIYISMENYNTVFWVLNCSLFALSHLGFVTYLYAGRDPEF